MKSLYRFLAAAMTATLLLQPITAFAEAETAPAAEEAAVEETAEPILTPEEETNDFGLTEIPPEEQEEPAAEEALPPEEPVQPADPNLVHILFNGQELNMERYARAVAGVTYVVIPDFFEAMGCQVTVDETGRKAIVTKGLELEAAFTADDRLARANSRCWYMDQPCILADGVLMIPVRAAAKIFTCTVAWDGASRAVLLEGGAVLETGKTFYDQEELMWLARIVYHEAGNQILDGKVAVANVVLNRKASTMFPDTVKDVIYDTRNGVQFIRKSDQTIFREPTDSCWVAAKLALEGYVTAPDCLFFTAEWRAPTCWAQKHRTVYATIGDHVFYL